MIVTARCPWVIDDLLEGRRATLLVNSHLSYLRLAVFAGIAASIFLVGWLRDWSHFPEWLQFLIKASAFISTLLAVIFPLSERLIRSRFSRHPEAGSELYWEISEDGVVVTGLFSRTELEWRNLYRVGATPKGIFIMPHKQLYYFLPAHAFAGPADMETVLEMASRLAPDFKRLK